MFKNNFILRFIFHETESFEEAMFLSVTDVLHRSAYWLKAFNIEWSLSKYLFKKDTSKARLVREVITFCWLFDRRAERRKCVLNNHFKQIHTIHKINSLKQANLYIVDASYSGKTIHQWKPIVWSSWSHRNPTKSDGIRQGDTKDGKWVL